MGGGGPRHPHVSGEGNWGNYTKGTFIHSLSKRKVLHHYSLKPLYASYAFAAFLGTYFTLRSCIMNPETNFSPAGEKVSSNNQWGFKQFLYLKSGRDYSKGEGKPPIEDV
ncbi:uncharacterized protein LOC143064013 [Mytilus galloprovincialis]|uniref:Uncharacterized protein n=1 Tax=Mytilus galloprovincialis TaxID=29158 RepID=A0A8B6H837_MYTGA|nr:Hypothetical predicted protein [Mytilus galloprovincialis]VDI79927.1 Hypothetical predicted protein [Mytilus galloprovincialis]